MLIFCLGTIKQINKQINPYLKEKGKQRQMMYLSLHGLDEGMG